MGGAVISKKIKAFLRQHHQTAHWHVQPALPHPDTYQLLTEQILAHPEDFLAQFTPLIQPKASTYKEFLLDTDAKSDVGHQKFANHAPWSDWKVYHHLLPLLPDDMALQSANSSVIRYLQLFKSGRNVPHYCNRGTSGIDGSTSTAAGFCYASQKQTLLITGDVSFFYDSNGLYHKYLDKNFKILLINNGGGGIFRIIDGPKDSIHLEEYFEAAQNLSAAPLATAFGLNYLSADNEADYLQLLPKFFAPQNRPVLMEVFTPQKQNASVLKQYFTELKNEY
jgi:2-succinyl-5-enolpyruvyl-6-hydroxy-3-cyclohexene-1-carboxylate synthase